MKLFNFSRLKKLSSYFIELIIVVLGVSIAFQLNVWNDNRKSRLIEEQLIQNFANENLFNQQESDSSLIYKRESIAAGLRFIDILNDEKTDVDSLK